VGKGIAWRVGRRPGDGGQAPLTVMFGLPRSDLGM
jgi:hypothetical protein